MSVPDIPFDIFPAGPNKAPLISGWQWKATRDPQTISQWHAHGARAWGIPCGAANGLFVIDLDVDKVTGDRIGEQFLMQAVSYAPLLDKINVRTPSGGAHIYLQHFDGARNTTGKIGKKIDTRGEGGFVIAPGSVTAGGEYKGYFPVLETVPFGLRALLLRQPATPARNTGCTTPTDEVRELLSHIPADLPYSDWLAVLMALHDRYGGSEEGLALADQWSAGGKKYRPGVVAAKWRSFKRSGVTFSTIPALARQHGADLSEIARRRAQ
ncbi:bifunctional DNA primase/polymerase [Mameliella sp.]|uniref:bifunctional DNA primase/polymerase n=1 Tax=Mameliella sp. TaxID=1924940 RepID=UPI003B510237